METKEQNKHWGGHPLLMGILFGFIFGFLLQKGGVAKYNVLIGQLLLRDWTVVKVMGTAVLVGMIGIYAMRAAGLVEFHIKKTKLGANAIGGLLFGAGFGLSAYCPGTNLAALGQGNWDALYVVAGLITGSYIFAETSARLAQTVERWGDRGKLTLFEMIRVPRAIFIPIMAILLVVVLFWLDRSVVR